MPPDLEDACLPCADVGKAVPLPEKHCAFQGCSWVKQHPCKFRRPPEYYLLQHLQTEHKDVFRKCCGEHCVETSKVNAEGEYLDYLEEAMKFKLQSGDMPDVNGAVDDAVQICSVLWVFEIPEVRVGVDEQVLQHLANLGRSARCLLVHVHSGA